MKEKPLYSTDENVRNQKDSGTQSPLSKGPFRVRLEKAGRAGKIVTVIFDIPLTEDKAHELRQTLQNQFGCGGTFKNATIELRGNLKDKVKQYFASQKWQIIDSGG